MMYFAEKIKAREELLCGHCLLTIKRAVVYRLGCDIHYACSEECKEGGCVIDACDHCDKNMTDSPAIPECKCTFHKSCLDKVGPDRMGKECAYCEETKKKPTKGSIFFFSPQATINSDAPLSASKLDRMQLRNWTVDSLAAKYKYTEKSIIESRIPYQRLKDFGFTLIHFKEKGVPLDALFTLYLSSSQMTPSEARSAVELYRPNFMELCTISADLAGVQMQSGDKTILLYMKTNMNMDAEYLQKMINRDENKAMDANIFKKETWLEIFTKKDFNEFIAPLFKEHDSLVDSVDFTRMPEKRSRARTSTTTSRRDEHTNDFMYKVKQPASATFL